ncbi:MAG: endonuclease [Betaproteobacteria bacterium]|nr:endonuclease [Betaproteobacteria bacterium]
MKLITWNIQWCRGCDGRVDPVRIARACRDMTDFDVLCVQEVARGFDSGLEGSHGEDQFRLLADALPGYALIEGVATDRAAHSVGGARRQFGNAIFSRLPVLQAFRHLLPWPADPAGPSMQRVAVEIIIRSKGHDLRVTTTHLEYYSPPQRAAQVEHLRALQAEAAGHSVVRPGQLRADHVATPFEPGARPASAILAADFNFLPSDPSYARLQALIDAGVPAYRDAWAIAHSGTAHAPTVGVHDKAQWPGDPFCFDFIFVTEDLAARVESVEVNAVTDASDHQPVLLRLAD